MSARFCPYPACGALSPSDADYCVECGASLVPAGPARKALGYRCPAHGQHVGVRNGHLAGRCGGCAEEAARGITQLCTTRNTTAGAGSTLDETSASPRSKESVHGIRP